MPRLTIVSSDQPTTLIEQLALALESAPLGPFDQETIVVQSRGTERWIRHELARRHGCAASLQFPFAASFFRALASSFGASPDSANQLSPDAIARAATTRQSDAVARDTLTWRILDLLESDLQNAPEFAPLHPFIGTPELPDTRKLLGLARTLAVRFEEYQLYRPDVLRAWELDENDSGDADVSARWQRSLWRHLRDTSQADDIAEHYLTAIERLNATDKTPAGLPRRLSVFGVNTLPPLFVRLLHAVARHIPVRIYLQAPPRATWSDTAPNPLFASFGRVVREFVALLEQHAASGAPIAWEEHHTRSDDGTNQSSSILAQLQADIRAGVQRGPESGLAAPHALRAGTVDESLALHRCHSPMREMEVLRDQLLAAFAADPTLRPHDVLLLLPDVATYAPFVEAVFGVGEPDLPHIPHRIADRPVVQESRLADAALRILRLVGARWTAAEIVELLDLPPVRRSARLSDGSSAQILAWIEETRIRWGRDGAMRHESFDLPAVEANSWRAGLDRLLMGYATGHTGDLVADVLPCAGDTIGDPATLGAFSRFIEQLFDTLTDWRTARTLADWSAALRAAFETLLTAEDDEERELEVVLAAVDRLATLDASGDDDDARTFELPVVRDWLEQLLADDVVTAGFLTGGMTVGALQPMRIVPHRIVAIAGLDDASFPRGQHRAAFDLVAVAPRLGDRDHRADDRQLFLDTLLATRERLILSCVARSAKTNAERAISVVIAELLDVVDRSFVASGQMAHALVEVNHRLQPFSAEYFTGDETSRLFSYSAMNARALAASGSEENGAPGPFITELLDVRAEDAERTEIRLEDLIACWSNPSRFFCERALSLRLPGESAPLEECEPMTVNHLDRYQVHDVMLRRHLAGDRTPERERIEAVALGNLPSGALSGVWFDKLDDDLRELLASLGTPTLEEPVAVGVNGSTWTLTGRVEGITGEGRLQVRPARCKPQDRIRAWITHLALTAAFGPTTTTLVANNGRWTFGEVADVTPLLDMLVEGYRAALREPITFFAQASYEYATRALEFEQATASGKPGRFSKSPMEMAHDGYEGSEFGEWATGDCVDAYVALCWRGRDPLAESGPARELFDRWSMAFWRPALNAMRAGSA